MNSGPNLLIVLIYLAFILLGVATALGALWYFARVRGGWFSAAGLFTFALLAVAVALVLVGFGVLPLPGGVA